MDSDLSIVWLRRDLRLHDHAALHAALANSGNIQPVFILDTDILKDFPNPSDRRLSFIANALIEIDKAFKKRGGGLLVLHGSAAELIPKLAEGLQARNLIAAADYEPTARKRDQQVADKLNGKVITKFVKDNVIFAPTEILRDGTSAYKVYTPYSKIWRQNLNESSYASYAINDSGRYADINEITTAGKQLGLNAINLEIMLETAGYKHVNDELWQVETASEHLSNFIEYNARNYAVNRDMVALSGTSKISPYLRFGLLSIRECVQAAIDAGAEKWLGELIWREFYVMILYHFPESATTEWNPKYRGTISWSSNPQHLQKWQEGKTGYPLVDAAMRQLLAEGWMHNRARMVVASFLTKHLQIDWRLGDAHFAQYLMDYDMASNVGGWQWAASTGTDAQPYFRVFNPTLQSERFDADGEYIRRYVPELRNVASKYIHAPWENPLLAPYIPPIVEHSSARQKAIALFAKATHKDE